MHLTVCPFHWNVLMTTGILQYRSSKYAYRMQVDKLKETGSRIVKSLWWWSDDEDDDYIEEMAEQVWYARDRDMSI